MVLIVHLIKYKQCLIILSISIYRKIEQHYRIRIKKMKLLWIYWNCNIFFKLKKKTCLDSFDLLHTGISN